jgi:hypothetical protein
MDKENCGMWILVIGTLVLLVSLGKIGLFDVLIPLSILLAYTIFSCSGSKEAKLTDSIKKG